MGSHRRRYASATNLNAGLAKTGIIACDTFDYEVIDFKTVAPNETGDIYIKDGRQLMTLITCTPDGHGGFGRYLVICEKK